MKLATRILLKVELKTGLVAGSNDRTASKRISCGMRRARSTAHACKQPKQLGANLFLKNAQIRFGELPLPPTLSNLAKNRLQ